MLSIFLTIPLAVSPSVFAQANYPIINTATTVVGEGGVPINNGGGTVNLPPAPTIDEFLKYFNVYQCQGYANNSNPQGCVLQGKTSDLTKFAYNVYSTPLRSNRYTQLLGVKNKKINLKFGSLMLINSLTHLPDPCAFSGGGAWDGNDIRLDGYTFADKCNHNNPMWSMIHESAHIIQSRAPIFFYTFRVNAFARVDGADCYDNGKDGPYIKTYRYRCARGQGSGCDGGGSQAESFGEAVGMTVVCGPHESCKKADIAIADYPTKCSYTYKWVRDNVYGGVDFFNPSSDGNQEVTSWAQKISSGLTTLGQSCLYNVQSQNICNDNHVCAAKLSGECNGVSWPAYLCTQLVVDSYKLAGIDNTFSLSTYYMERAWEKKSGYRVLKTNVLASDIRQLQPGDVIFRFKVYADVSGKHVVVIKNIDVDSNLNGEIVAVQANSYGPTTKFTISRGTVIPHESGDILMFGLGPRK